MRIQMMMASLMLTGCTLMGQTPAREIADSKSPASVKRTPPPPKQQGPPLLQQYDFSGQIEALQGDIPIASGEIRPVFADTDPKASQAPEIQRRSDIPLTSTAAEAVHMSETWRGGQ